jgi:hypothetical protein
MRYHHQVMTPGEIEAEERRRDAEEQLKQLGQWQNVIALNLGIWIRNGPSEAIRQQIADASNEYGICFQKIVGSSPHRLSGSK